MKWILSSFVGSFTNTIIQLKNIAFLIADKDLNLFLFKIVLVNARKYLLKYGDIHRQNTN